MKMNTELRRVGDLKVIAVCDESTSILELFVTTKNGGVSAGSFGTLNLGDHVDDIPQNVAENRLRVADLFQSETSNIFFLNQVHSNHVVTLDNTCKRNWEKPDADAIVTSLKNVVLGILVADCVPIALYDPKMKVLGMAHAGWRGTASNVGKHTIEAMQNLGSDPINISAYLGPSIPKSSYEVGSQVSESLIRTFLQEHIDLSSTDVIECIEKITRRIYVDLTLANEILLKAAGLKSENITKAKNSTDTKDLFYSHRRDHSTGRFGLFARMRT